MCPQKGINNTIAAAALNSGWDAPELPLSECPVLGPVWTDRPDKFHGPKDLSSTGSGPSLDGSNKTCPNFGVGYLGSKAGLLINRVNYPGAGHSTNREGVAVRFWVDVFHESRELGPPTTILVVALPGTHLIGRRDFERQIGQS